MADITLGEFYNAIQQGAREGTLEALKNKDFATQATLSEIEQRLTAIEQALEIGEAKVQLKGRIDDLAPNRPAANSVDTGTVFWAVDTGEVSVSTGSEWRSLGVA